MDSKQIQRVIEMADRVAPDTVAGRRAELVAMLLDPNHVLGLFSRLSWQVGYNRGYLDGREDEAYGREQRQS